MPVYQIELDDGRKLKIDAEDQTSALAGVQHYTQQNPVTPRNEYADKVNDFTAKVGRFASKVMADPPPTIQGMLDMPREVTQESGKLQRTGDDYNAGPALGAAMLTVGNVVGPKGRMGAARAPSPVETLVADAKAMGETTASEVAQHQPPTPPPQPAPMQQGDVIGNPKVPAAPAAPPQQPASVRIADALDTNPANAAEFIPGIGGLIAKARAAARLAQNLPGQGRVAADSRAPWEAPQVTYQGKPWETPKVTDAGARPIDVRSLVEKLNAKENTDKAHTIAAVPNLVRDLNAADVNSRVPEARTTPPPVDVKALLARLNATDNHFDPTLGKADVPGLPAVIRPPSPIGNVNTALPPDVMNMPQGPQPLALPKPGGVIQQPMDPRPLALTDQRPPWSTPQLTAVTALAKVTKKAGSSKVKVENPPPPAAPPPQLQAPAPQGAPSAFPEMPDFLKRTTDNKLPSTTPEKILNAAVKTDDGRVFSGQFHSDAAAQAQAKGLKIADADGFVTTNGRYVGRKEAVEIVDRAKQLAAGPAKRRGELLAEDLMEDRKRTAPTATKEVAPQPITPIAELEAKAKPSRQSRQVRAEMASEDPIANGEADAALQKVMAARALKKAQAAPPNNGVTKKPQAPSRQDQLNALVAYISNPKGLREWATKQGVSDAQVADMIHSTYDHPATAKRVVSEYMDTKEPALSKDTKSADARRARLKEVQDAVNTVSSRDNERSIDLMQHTASGMSAEEAAADIADNMAALGKHPRDRGDFISYVAAITEARDTMANKLARSLHIPPSHVIDHMRAVPSQAEALRWRGELQAHEPTQAGEIENIMSDKLIKKLWKRK